MRHYDGAVTGRCIRKDVVLALIRKGLARDCGIGLLMDDDCSPVEPERYRRVYDLTEEGVALVEHHRKVMASK